MRRPDFGTSLVLAASLTAHALAQPSPTPPASPRRLSLENRPWTGDFDAMVERRVIRMLVPYSRTLYYNDKGRERGLTADLGRDFEGYLNKKLKPQLKNRPITVFLIPTTRDKLLSGLIEGRGDIAAGNLTATEARQKLVAFAAPKELAPVSELVVTGPGAPAIATIDDLSGKTVHVRKVTSHYDSLTALNARFAKEKKPPVRLELLPDALESEDILEMLNAGLFQITIMDDWVAKTWAPVLPHVKVHADVAVRQGDHIGWAYRKNSPQLEAALNDFWVGFLKKQAIAQQRLAQTMKRVKQISNNTKGAEWKRFQDTVALFRTYGAKYGFDPVMLAAQGYQESRLDQNAKSHVGAVGVMQIMPATGKELAVGDIAQIEPNIHGGAKYMDRLMTRFFSDAKFSEENRPLFAFAAYNAGPGNISKMRKEASRRGLDPDKWFNNVEIVVAEKIGIETTTYVRNIYKYYAAYKMQMAAAEEREKARRQVAPAVATPKPAGRTS